MRSGNKLILFLALLGIATSSVLVVNEIKTPCYCPTYPLLAVPACYMVLGYFSLITLSCLTNILSKTLFFVGSIGGLITALWFTANQLLGYVQCPVFLSVPLCFVALATFALIIYLKISIQQK